jgi:hypothetical protein
VHDEDGEHLVIDARADQLTGNSRYYFPDPRNEPDLVARMAAGHVGYGHGNHAETCPRAQRERRL